MRPWSRYIRASISAYARVFVYLCGTPENPAETEREREREEGGRENKKKEKERKKEREKIRRAREEPSPVKGKNEDGGKSQWPAKVCCPFVMRERVGR